MNTEIDGKATQPINPVEMYIKLNEFLIKEYPTITVGDMECLIALMIMDDDVVAREVAPDKNDLSIEETIEKVLFAMGSVDNALTRVMEILNAFYARIKAEKEAKNNG